MKSNIWNSMSAIPQMIKNGNNEYNLSLRLANLFTKYDFERIRQSC